MRAFRPLLGVLGVVGTWENWERFFDFSRRGLQVSFIALLATLPAFYFIGTVIQSERARAFETDVVAIPLAIFVAILGLFLLSFSALAYMITLVFERQDRFRPWVIARHWAVFFMASVVALLFALFYYGPLPFMVANGAAMASYFGLLFIDIRLLKRIVGFDWGTSTLLACIIVTIGLVLLMLGIQQAA